MSQFESYRVKLENELNLTINDLSAVAKQDQATGDWEAVPVGTESAESDGNVGADVVEEWNERRALVATLELRYRNIIRALDKIKLGTYGICELSGEPIEPKRLEANPAARTNIANRERDRELSL